MRQACRGQASRHRMTSSAVEAAAEVLAQQKHRFRLSVDLRSVHMRRLPSGLASVYAVATLPPELPGEPRGATKLIGS